MNKKAEVCALKLACDVNVIAITERLRFKLKFEEEKKELLQKKLFSLDKDFQLAQTFCRNLISLSMFRLVFIAPSTSLKSCSSFPIKDRPISIFSSINSRSELLQVPIV